MKCKMVENWGQDFPHDDGIEAMSATKSLHRFIYFYFYFDWQEKNCSMRLGTEFAPVFPKIVGVVTTTPQEV